MDNSPKLEQSFDGAPFIVNGIEETDAIATHSDGIPIVVKMNDSTNTNDPPSVKFLPSDFYSHHLSDLAKERQPSSILSLFPLENTPGLISMLAGKPNASTFPFTSLQFTARSPTDPSIETTLKLSDKDLSEGLQYGRSHGHPSLMDWAYGLQEYSHGRKKGEGWRLSVGCGSQDLIHKAVMTIVNPGDSVLLETPVYSGVIPMFQSLHCESIEVDSDSDGPDSSALRSILEKWPSNKPKPKVLYTVPCGCNPTGVTTTVERRREILNLAREHDFLILEDDPYYYLYFGDTPRPPSYFALELEQPEVGRVMRFDSLSKLLSAGLRIGFASGPERLILAMDEYTATSNLHPAGLTQVIAATLLDSWGYDTFITHTQNVCKFYRHKRDVFERALRQHLDGLAQWSTPEAGMFFWFKLLLNRGADAESEDDSASIIRTKAFERGVLALPGTVFLPSGRKTGYVRAAFSLLSDRDIEEGLRRLKVVILEARLGGN